MLRSLSFFCLALAAFATPAFAAEPIPTSQEIIDALLPGGLEERANTGARTLDGLFNDGRGITVQGSELTVPSIDLQIAFEFDSDMLLTEAVLTLERLGEALIHEAFADTRFRIVGHTDARGGDQYNADLSLRRANAVVDYLVSNYPIASDRLDVEGLGRSLLPPGIDPEDERNRRVEIQNIGS